MTRIDEVRAEMIAAMKAGDKPKKDALSALLAALKNKAIDTRQDLTQEEEDKVVIKEIKQLKETLDLAPEDRTDIKDECNLRISVLEKFAPKMLNEEEIQKIIQEVLNKLGIEAPDLKDKGKIIKEVMEQVKGRVDGKTLNDIISIWL